MSNAFFLEAEEYNRDINVLSNANKQLATYLHKKTGKDYDVCLGYVRKEIAPGGKHAIRDPVMNMFIKNEHGDRERATQTVTEYLKDVTTNQEIMAGTLTTYISSDKIVSESTGFLEKNIKGRSIAKHRMFEAIANNDSLNTLLAFTEQNGKKTTCNAMSGAQAAKSTPLHNSTGHSTLTSTCRMTSGYGNANNEKFVAGNRHYWSYDIVVNNIASIITNTDYAKLEKVMNQFNLHYPTPDECLQCVLYSSKFYWRKEISNMKLLDTFIKLTPLERAAFVYTGDFYQIANHNGVVVRELLRRLSTISREPVTDPDAILKAAHGDVKTFACLICSPYLKGTKLENIKDKPEYLYYVATVKNITDTIADYFDFIRVFMASNNVPASVSNFPHSTRRVVVASDTDSTIYTVQDWVNWYCGDILFTEEANAVGDTVVFLSAQSITHILALMSTNMGVSKSNLFLIAMKNEYKFDIFVPANVGKHYYAVMSSQEGIVFEKLKKEIKGVHLKSSSAPKEITEQAEKLMLHICTTIMAGKKINIKDILTAVGNTERKILEAIASGQSIYFRKAQIKPASTYKRGEETSVFKQYKLWNDVFGPKYGLATEPPYQAIKVNVSLANSSGTTDWLNGLKDKELAKRVIEYMASEQKNFLGGTIYVPEAIARSHGLPTEIIEAASTRELIKNVTNVFYIILETLGVYMSNDKITRLVMDTH